MDRTFVGFVLLLSSCLVVPSLGVFSSTQWVLQTGTALPQYTICQSVTTDLTSHTCVMPEIRYGNITGGIPRQHSGNQFPTWCISLGYVSSISVSYGTRNVQVPYGALFGCQGYDESPWHWCDWWDGYWYNQDLGWHNSDALDITAFSCGVASDGTTCNDNNPCTTNDVWRSGVCSGTAINDGGSCNDGNTCTSNDVCRSGVCTGTATVCTAMDQCHDAGTCSPTTGCSNPLKPTGTPCNDGNQCTQTDICQTGVCRGSNPVICRPSDQCHNVGNCDTTTGICSDPAKPDHSLCNDGNQCTQLDTCQSGVCRGTNPVNCGSLDQCHVVGVCNPATGICSNPTIADGTPCNDGNFCFRYETCQSGNCTGTPVVCRALDQCHLPGVCNTATGSCTNPLAADGTSCNDNDRCTRTDTCRNGICVGTNPVVCTAVDQCHSVGTCNIDNGLCDNPTIPDGTACNDNDLCSQADTCQSGTCTGANRVVCTALDQCHLVGVCNPATGVCSNPNVTCVAIDDCHEVGLCGAGGCDNPEKSDGTPCNDGNGGTINDVCTNGICGGVTTGVVTTTSTSAVATSGRTSTGSPSTSAAHIASISCFTLLVIAVICTLF